MAEKVAAFEQSTRSSPRLAAAKQDLLQLTSPQAWNLRLGLPHITQPPDASRLG